MNTLKKNLQLMAVLFVSLVLLYDNGVFANTINVPADHPTIQGAIDAASGGDELGYTMLYGKSQIMCVILIAVISKLTPKANPEMIKGLTFGSVTKTQKEETQDSWNKWDVIHTAIIMGLIITFYWVFW